MSNVLRVHRESEAVSRREAELLGKVLPTLSGDDSLQSRYAAFRSLISGFHVHSAELPYIKFPELSLMARADECALPYLAITDHNSVAGLRQVLKWRQQYKVEVIPGVEITANLENTQVSVHVLGYGIDPEILSHDDPTNAMQTQLAMNTREAIHLINYAGGVSVLAHPGHNLLHRGDYPKRVLQELKGQGLAGVEAFTPKHSQQKAMYYVRLADELGLTVFGGSDLHDDLNMMRPMPDGVKVKSWPTIDAIKSRKK